MIWIVFSNISVRSFTSPSIWQGDKANGRPCNDAVDSVIFRVSDRTMASNYLFAFPILGSKTKVGLQVS